MAFEPKIAVVLGGGGARGLSHLGVLQVLEREKIPIHCIVGTSVGALVGASYALDPDAVGITRRALAYLKSPAFRNDSFRKVLLKSEDTSANFFRNLLSGIRKSYVFSNLLRKPSIFPPGHLEAVINDLLPDRTFADVRIPFAVPALDIRSGCEVRLDQGSLRMAVLASCSLPGFFPPVKIGDMLLADAGVIGPVPVSIGRSFDPSAVIAVDITSRLDYCPPISRGLDTILRVEAIAGKRLNDLELEHADVIVRPQVGTRYWSDFSDLDQIVEAGVTAAESVAHQLRELVSMKPKRRLSFRLWGTGA